LGTDLELVRRIVGEAKIATSIRRHMLLLLISREVEDPERDGRVGNGIAVHIHHPADNNAMVVRRDVDIPDENRDRDDARHQNKAVGEDALPFSWTVHPLVAPEVRPWMNSFCAIKKRTRPGARTMMQKA